MMGEEDVLIGWLKRLTVVSRSRVWRYSRSDFSNSDIILRMGGAS